MTKNTIIFRLLLAVSVIAGFAACKKKSSSTPAKPQCKIVALTDNYSGNTTAFTITYGNDGKVSTLVAKGSSNFRKVFTYSGSMIFINVSDTTGTVTETDTVTLNSSNLVLSVHQHYSASSYYYTTMTYDATNQLATTTATSGGTPTVTTYSWTNGDMTQSTDGSTTSTYTYYTDKNAEDGDLFQVEQLVQYGAFYINNKHLIKGTGGSTVLNCNYVFDTDGKITSLTATNGANVETISYQYQCQ